MCILQFHVLQERTQRCITVVVVDPSREAKFGEHGAFAEVAVEAMIWSDIFYIIIFK